MTLKKNSLTLEELGVDADAPSAGEWTIYSKSDGVYVVDDLGNVTGPFGTGGGGGAVDSVNGQTGVVVLDPDDLDDTSTTNKFTSAADISKLAGIEAGADVTDAANVEAAGAVMESDYDANTILAATSDDTPAPLTVAEQTVVGRITGGNIAALSASQLATLALSGALPENVSIQLDDALSADGTYSGIVEAGVANSTLLFGRLVYFQTSNSRWEFADADAEATAGPVKLGMVVQAAATTGDPVKVLLFGKIRADALFPALTVGAPVYVSTTAGGITSTAPTGSADIVRIIGYGNTADELFFNPESSYLELV